MASDSTSTRESRGTPPPMPDLGEVRVRPNPDDPASPFLNIASVIKLARDAGTPNGDRVCRTYVAALDRMKDGPGSEKEKRMAALEEGLAAIGARVAVGLQ